MVADRLELGLTEKDDVGELESTDPAPTATNEIFVDCNQFAVKGSVSPTVQNVPVYSGIRLFQKYGYKVESSTTMPIIPGVAPQNAKTYSTSPPRTYEDIGSRSVNVTTCCGYVG